jgi:hypothetical protein
MRRAMTAVIVMILCFIMLVPAQESQQQKGPVIYFEQESFDFGEINEGVVAVHEFSFQNTGSDTLRISNVLGS